MNTTLVTFGLSPPYVLFIFRMPRSIPIWLCLQIYLNGSYYEVHMVISLFQVQSPDLVKINSKEFYAISLALIPKQVKFFLPFPINIWTKMLFKIRHWYGVSESLMLRRSCPEESKRAAHLIIPKPSCETVLWNE